MAKDVPKLEIRTETEVVDCAQSADAVEVEIRSPQGKHERIKGRYLIGADGTRSTVRRCIGVEFGGFTYGERFADHRHALRFLAGRLRLSQLHLRSGGMVQSVQDCLERTTRESTGWWCRSS